ncbi:hypothetical protein SDC9_73390 [bioreactor metagenome]|uniref:Peptidase S8/S53 domain-containing protein n=1 Tax=bioreactor metagenome TaxID=1076179 RepID=A0A644YE98_9ZZZZ
MEYRHIFLTDKPLSKKYVNPNNHGNKPNLPERDRASQSRALREKWEDIWNQAREIDERISAVSMPTRDGVYVEFIGKPGFDLMTNNLEARRSGIILRNIRSITDDDGQETIKATLFIPTNKRDWLIKKINEYAEEETKNEKPKNDPLIRSIEDIRIALIESFWTDDKSLIPSDVPEWCEVWLTSVNEANTDRFFENARSLGVEVGTRKITFPDRTVVLARVTKSQLSTLIEINPSIAEYRKAREAVQYFINIDNQEQTEWVRDLQSRLITDLSNNVAICLLDSGVNNGHSLIEPVLMDSDLHTVNPDWGVSDNTAHRHGTLMSGIAAYGDISEILTTRDPIYLSYRLESVKILPPIGSNPPDLYGDITIQGLSRAEIQAPQRTHISCMAVTSKDGRDRGKPSSWSAAIDMLTSGYNDDKRRLFILSAGNIDDSEWGRYPDGNITDSIHDPGQSWNAITVGAYTEKSTLFDSEYESYMPLAERGQLSPFSTTSMVWSKEWPFKPEIVLEGGNLAKDCDGIICELEDLSLLSTGPQPTLRQFGLINATSAACALAARMAAKIQAMYPSAWPETVRGLMIHSAEWPSSLVRQVLSQEEQRRFGKTEIKKLLRVCGYGVPNLSKAIACKTNLLTLISENEIQPFTRDGSRYVTNEMHLHKLPWPTDTLLDLGETNVTLRVTLSYFIEPGPGEVGWKNKYRYASYALRFDLNKPGESESMFINRLSAAAAEEDEQSSSDSGSARWVIGKNNCKNGSIHSDYWSGTAADLAATNLIGIFPAIGWWRERPWQNRWDRKARYSLIVSLQTPEETMDVYTPIAIMLNTPIDIQI